MTGAELRAWRIKRAWHPDKLAMELGVSRRTIERWENGDVHVPPYMADTLVGVLIRLEQDAALAKTAELARRAEGG